MSQATSTKPGIYVVIQILTTADDNSQYISKDSSEIVEIAWSFLDSVELTEIHKDSTLVKPINTAITPLCTSTTGLTWESVKNAQSLKDAITKLDESINKFIIANDLPFNFVTFNSWDLRMKLPKESREKSIQLPRYLEYSRHFDLKREYIKLQESLYPETSNSNNVNQITLNHIVSTLDIDLRNLKSVSDEITGQFNLSIPRRAGDNTQIVTEILKSLIKLAPSYVPILKKPHDLNLDLNQFFTEQSRILYMTNLPIDTTQSELESWFTQFGGRPIAFWTIKSPPSQDCNNSNNISSNVNSITNINYLINNHNSRSNSTNGTNDNSTKLTCSGFAIFATHEEAIDSLAMNGRTLSEKIIEVQPSSVRVLDKAQEILTPFPSSKNRPRPGDWTCPSCGFSNFQRRTACFRCSFPAASAAAIQESMYGNSNVNNNNSSNNNSNTNHSNNNGNNHSSNGNANNNYYNNHNQQHSQQMPQNNANVNSFNNDNVHHHHHNHQNNNINHNNQHNGNSHNSNQNYNTNNSMHSNNRQQNSHKNQSNNNNNSSNVPFRAGDWKCVNENCSYHNFAKNVCCLKCGAPRVQSAILNGHAHNPHHQHTNNNNSSSNNGTNNHHNGHHQNQQEFGMGSPSFRSQRISTMPPLQSQTQQNHTSDNVSSLNQKNNFRSHSQPGSDTIGVQSTTQQLYQQFPQLDLHKTMSLPSSQQSSLSDSNINNPPFQPLMSQGNTPIFSSGLTDFKNLTSRIGGLNLSQPMQAQQGARQQDLNSGTYTSNGLGSLSGSAPSLNAGDLHKEY